jgi:hypothetical protein
MSAKAGPQAVLLLVVDQHEEAAVVVVERVSSHGALPSKRIDAQDNWRFLDVGRMLPG